MNYPQGVLFIFLLIRVLQIGAECPGGIPVFGSLSQAIPSLRNMPGMNFIPNNKGIDLVPENKNLDTAIEQFSEPLVRFATGGQPVSSDIEQLISSIPNLLVNIPGVGNVDISKLPPQLIDHVLKGGQVPGVSKETLDAIMKQYMQKMYALAANAQNMRTDIQLTPKDYQNAHRFLPPLTKLPQRFVSNVMEGNSLPFLTPNETQVVKDYYIKRLPINQQDYSIANDTNLPFSPQLIQMMKVLPQGYNLSKLPKEVMQQIMKGELPDFTLLPDDILQHIRENADELFGTLSAIPNVTVEEILKKLPAYERPLQPTFSPYDINKVDSGGIIMGQEDDKKRSRLRLLMLILLGFVGVITIVIVAFSCYYVKHNRTPNMPSNGISPDDEFQPRSSSTTNTRSSKNSPNVV